MKFERPFNFYAGPAILPFEVMKDIKEELLDFRNTGLSIMEISHRSKEFDAVVDETISLVKELLSVPDDYSVLFIQGGASMQFAMIPMNFLNNGTADFVDTGTWASKAIKEAKNFGAVNVAASSKDKNYSYIPDNFNFTKDARYVHITGNETINGTQYKIFPDTGDVPLIADMSSEIMSRKLDVSKFSMIYAGAQKNISIAGVALVIIKNDLLDKADDSLPTMLKYKTYVEKKSMFNTPPVFAIYVMNKVLTWLKNNGGIENIEKINNEKAKLLYDIIDSGDFYTGTAEKESRSNMNVTFRLKSEDLEQKFISEAKSEGFIGVKGHRSVGGCRASIYNAMPLEGVKYLAEFMKEFQKNNS